MGEASLETSPKNIRIQDMMNSENSTNTTESTNTNIFKNISTVGDSFSTVEVAQYNGDGFSTGGDSISTVEVVQYSGGTSVLWRVFSTVEGIQYIGGQHQYMRGDNISTVGDNISTVESIQYSGGYLQYSGDLASVLWGE